MDRTDGLDGTNAGGPRNGGQRRQMVQLDRQALLASNAAGGLCASSGQPRRGRSRSCHGRTLREEQGRQSAGSERGAAQRTLPTAADPTTLYSQTGKCGTAPTGDTNGS